MFSDLVASMSNHVRLLRVAVYATAQAKGKMLHPHIGIIIAWKEKNNRREKNMIEGVLFDLGNTVVLFPALGVETEELSAERKSMLKSLVKIMCRSLKEQGLEAD